LIRINKLTDYAMLLLARMASDPARLHSAQQLASLSALETPTVSKVLKLLNQAELLESVRGARGGYRLARCADDISILDIISAIEGPFAMVECSIAPGRCDHEANCGYKGNWQVIENEIRRLLARLSISDMQQQLRPGMLSGRSSVLPIDVRDSA